MQKTEFIRVYSEMFPNGNAKEFSSYIFNVFDRDGSGSALGFTNFEIFHFNFQIQACWKIVMKSKHSQFWWVHPGWLEIFKRLFFYFE